MIIFFQQSKVLISVPLLKRYHHLSAMNIVLRKREASNKLDKSVIVLCAIINKWFIMNEKLGYETNPLTFFLDIPGLPDTG